MLFIGQGVRTRLARQNGVDAGMVEIARSLDGAANTHPMGDLPGDRAALPFGLGPDELHDVITEFHRLSHDRLLPTR